MFLLELLTCVSFFYQPVIWFKNLQNRRRSGPTISGLKSLPVWGKPAKQIKIGKRRKLVITKKIIVYNILEGTGKFQKPMPVVCRFSKPIINFQTARIRTSSSYNIGHFIAKLALLIRIKIFFSQINRLRSDLWVKISDQKFLKRLLINFC